MRPPPPNGLPAAPNDAFMSLAVLVSVFLFIVLVVIVVVVYARATKAKGDPVMKRHLGTYERDGWGPHL